MIKRRLLSLLSLLVVGAMLVGAPALAAPDTNTYTVQVAYYDDIQMTYNIPGPFEDEQHVGDIPIGGAFLGSASGSWAISQVYCIDAAVPFHSYARDGQDDASTEGSGAEVLDTVPNYVAVSPDLLPASQRENWDEIVWILQNGFSDMNSLVRMRAELPGLSSIATMSSVDLWKVAVMATKAAIWHFTNGVEIISTNFTPEIETQFYLLLNALIDGAEKASPAAEYSPAEQFTLNISGGSATMTPTRSGGVDFYGPFTATASSGVKSLEKVYLEISSDTTGNSAGFYTAAQPSAAIPANLVKYGLTDAEVNRGSGIDIGTPFYIGIPENSQLANGKPVTIEAFTRGQTTASYPIPTVLVHQNADDGSQDWYTVQAFVGLSTGSLTVYGSGRLTFNTPDSPPPTDSPTEPPTETPEDEVSPTPTPTPTTTPSEEQPNEETPTPQNPATFDDSPPPSPSGSATPPETPGESQIHDPEPPEGGANPPTGDADGYIAYAVLFAAASCGVLLLLRKQKKRI
ncbi:MAG: thioester domain-containing protein [Oscillospiraceae bacterium]|jgi:TQXA domain-containing protein|nr:thioester domain-containing protein [Oscillospiraceae bacterium]